MKLLITGDQHRTFSCPANRTDKYGQTGLRKFKQMIDIANKHNVSAMVIPGDIFDSCTVSYETVREYIKLHNTAPNCYVIAGQHDQRYHTHSIDNTPLGVLVAACPSICFVHNSAPAILDNVAFYGASWGDTVPDITTPDCFNVLVIHRMVINETLAWETQTEDQYTKASALVSETGYDLVVSGDNHQQFWYKKHTKMLFNMGSLMRSSTAQAAHRPAVVIYDTATREHEKEYLDIESYETVFRAEAVARDKEHNIKMEEFVKCLNSEDMPDLDFMRNVQAYINKTELHTGVRLAMQQAFPNNTKLEV